MGLLERIIFFSQSPADNDRSDLSDLSDMSTVDDLVPRLPL